MDIKTKLRNIMANRARATQPNLAPEKVPTNTRPAPAPTEVRTTCFPVSWQHGCVTLSETLPLAGHFLQLAGMPLLQDGGNRSLLFLDAETTGLSGGTGTYIFLMGLGVLRPGHDILTIDQHFLIDPSGELPFLERIMSIVENADLLVCFNGKTYDLPLLNTRLTLNGLSGLDPARPVLDLLPTARRRWKSFIGRCDLRNLEAAVLGFYRDGDIPGELVPEIYFRWLRGYDCGGIEAVFQHNLWDILGMAALLGHFNRMFRPGDELDLAAFHCLLEYFLRQGATADFLRLIEPQEAVFKNVAMSQAHFGKTFGRLLKKSGRRDEAYQIFLHLSNYCPRDTHDIFEEILIHEEHHLRDLPLALKHCAHFMEIATQENGCDNLLKSLRYRQRRIEGKLNRKIDYSTTDLG